MSLKKAIKSIKESMAFYNGDWCSNHRTAWIWCILYGIPDDCLEDFKKDFKWSDSTIDRLKKLNTSIKEFEESKPLWKDPKVELPEEGAWCSVFINIGTDKDIVNSIISPLEFKRNVFVDSTLNSDLYSPYEINEVKKWCYEKDLMKQTEKE